MSIGANDIKFLHEDHYLECKFKYEKFVLHFIRNIKKEEKKKGENGKISGTTYDPNSSDNGSKL
jgi:hypothetical protein